MQIYRLENPEGFGPWNDDGPDDYLAPARVVDRLIWRRDEGHRAPSDHPSPWQDIGTEEIEDWRLRLGIGSRVWKCAFRSIEQYAGWFGLPRGQRYLARRGFDLVAYEVPPDCALVGEHQVLFVPSEAIELERLSPIL